MKPTSRSRAALQEELLSYFRHYEGEGAPSFVKFATAHDMSPSDIEALRTHREFEGVYQTCREIRRDILIDNALCKRADSSLVRFLLTAEFHMGAENVSKEERQLSVLLTVVP